MIRSMNEPEPVHHEEEDRHQEDGREHHRRGPIEVLLLVHETLFISASVAIRNSANGGKWMIRKINQPRTSAKAAGSPNRQCGVYSIEHS